MSEVISVNSQEFQSRIDLKKWGQLGSSQPHVIDLVDPADLDTASLREIKTKARRQYKKLAKRWHPDILRNKTYKMKSGCSGDRAVGLRRGIGKNFVRLTGIYQRLINRKKMPLTASNMIAVLEVTKGYISSHDVDLDFYRSIQ